MNNVISKKIYIKRNDFLKLKSFLLSLFIHATILAIVLYSNISEPTPLSAEEKTVVISLASYMKTDVQQKMISKPVQKVEKYRVVKVQKKLKKVKKAEKSKEVKKVIKTKTPEKIAQKRKEIAQSSEAFTPQQSNVESVTKEDSLQATSSHLISPSTNKALPTKKAQLNDIGKKELAQIRWMIENSLSYPAIAKKLKIEGVVVVSFSLKQDGYLENIHIVSSSGSSTLDKKALQTVSSLDGEYPHLEKKVDLKIPIAFSLKKS